MLEGPEFKGNIGNIGGYEVDLTEDLKLKAKLEFEIDVKERLSKLIAETKVGQWLKEKLGVQV